MWRFEQAKKRDLPIGFIAKDHTLMALAQSNPKNMSAMLNIEGAEALDIRHKGKAMLAVLAKAGEVTVNDYPKTIKRLDEYPGYKHIFKSVKAFLTVLSERQGLTIENVASKKQINQFLNWQFNLNGARTSETAVELLSYWRKELFGKALLEFAKQGFK